jgi:hypothetical protein
MFAEYTQRAEKMDDHVRGLEQILREKDIQLSGERGQVEIWKQRAEEWCDKYHTLESESRVNLKTLTKEEATALVTEYGIAILQRSRFQIPRTMKKLLNYLVGKPDIVGIARECLEDVITHHSDFLKACETMVAGESGEDGVGYWQHQVNVLKRMEAQAKAVLKETTWHAGSNSRRMG